MAKRVTYTCDCCGNEIHDVVYKLTCWAKDANPHHMRVSGDVIDQNRKQNEAEQDHQSRHLCGKCKDKLTDGLFIV